MYNFNFIKKGSSSDASYRKSSKRNHDVEAVVTISDKGKSTVFDRYGQLNHNFYIDFETKCHFMYPLQITFSQCLVFLKKKI